MTRFFLFLIFSMFAECAIPQDSVKVETKFPELQNDNEKKIFQDYFLKNESQEEFNFQQIQEIKNKNFVESEQGMLEKSAIKSVIIDVREEKIVIKSRKVFDPNFEANTGSQSKIRTLEYDDALENETDRLFGPTKADSRVQTRALNPAIVWQHRILEMSKSVGMIVETAQLSQISDSVYQLEIMSSLGRKFLLCPGEAFENEPSVGVGTAFTVADSSMITAAHVFAGNPTNYAVVFGIEIINQNGVYNAFIPKENVYFVNAIEHKDLDLDLIQFRTDRVINRKPLDVDLDESSKVNDEICMIGHPMGLPQKVAVNASILSTEYPYHYFTSLDAFQGNSGSPVIHVESGKVIGVLVSGGSDYQWNGSCNKSVVCNYPNCMGERVAKLRTFLNEKTQ